ncbi:hypothetical protein Bhyg_10895 [Pseudolycoriella hygida]|uniref:Uncharacterized protein n=1 Tax=Pseudolycoriella hygida TaxID=35572 RepID=A0A9Q0RZ42_9DIPT|nr:hypothetical protein Bhyg_10895 [Pseudolycoriella hygida]
MVFRAHLKPQSNNFIKKNLIYYCACEIKNAHGISRLSKFEAFQKVLQFHRGDMIQ